MRFKRITWISVVVASVVCGAVCNAAAKPDTLVYEVKMKSGSNDLGTRKMSMKGPYFVFTVSTSGMNFVFIKNKDGAYLVNPLRPKTLGKYPPGSNRNSPMVFLPGPVGDVKAFLKKNKAKKIGTEKIGKTPCDKYYYVENETRVKCTLSVAQKTMQPMKLVMPAKQNKKIVSTYVSYKLGAEVPDSLFTLPKDAKIRPMR